MSQSIPVHAPVNVSAVDAPDPDAGNACHHYVIQYGGPGDVCHIQFQHGARGTPGSSPGIFDDALLAIVQHRLEGFQSGSFACGENADALGAVKEAREALAVRVAARMKQNVLGVNEKHS